MYDILYVITMISRNIIILLRMSKGSNAKKSTLMAQILNEWKWSRWPSSFISFGHFTNSIIVNCQMCMMIWTIWVCLPRWLNYYSARLPRERPGFDSRLRQQFEAVNVDECMTQGVAAQCNVRNYDHATQTCATPAKTRIISNILVFVWVIRNFIRTSIEGENSLGWFKRYKPFKQLILP